MIWISGYLGNSVYYDTVRRVFRFTTQIFVVPLFFRSNVKLFTFTSFVYV